MAKDPVTCMQAESLGTAEGRNSFQIACHNLDHQALPILMSSEELEASYLQDLIPSRARAGG